ncbi:uncharacterized protein L201_002775 [Kwoniella dendrophila CBS 6074]|uniref:Uncharacterized protein n=1 Tax=Kwoniella dendrophila CBS 6074 TaxID=1295534 RepID=A0AAX4JR05_9TREE
MASTIGLGLGLGFTSVDFEKPSSTIIVAKPTSTQDVSSKATHPVYQIPVPERSHRGPRSLGVGKRFVSSPSENLPSTIYDKSSSNPLSIPPTNIPLSSNPDKNAYISMNNIPINSPQLGLDLVNINPTQHLRQMKKRSLQLHSSSSGCPSLAMKRNFGVNSSEDPWKNLNQPSSSSDNSPTIGSSPTLNSSNSPIIPSSSPIPDSTPQHHVDMLGPSIALSVVLGLLVLGVASWVGIHYRRKRLSLLHNQEDQDGDYQSNRRERDSDEKSFTSEMFNASNVVEKGLKPKSSNTNNGNELRSSFISYKRPLSIIHHHQQQQQPSNGGGGGRRVSFVDTVHHQSQNGQDEFVGEQRGGNMRESILPPPRFMVASLHQPEPDLSPGQAQFVVGEYEGEEEEEEEEEEYEHPVPSPRSSIAPTLEMIEEEVEEENTSFEQNADQKEEDFDITENSRLSMISTTSSKTSDSASSTCSGDYTTASARSSISSLSALSIISSSFPQTPRDQSTPPPHQIDNHTDTPTTSSTSNDNKVMIGGELGGSPILDDSGNGIYDSPTPASKFQSRRKRAQSQIGTRAGLVEVQKHDLLRTAVGRTMSLQPTKEVREFIKLMTTTGTQNDIDNMPIPKVPILTTINQISTLPDNDNVDVLCQTDKQVEKKKTVVVQQQDEMEDLRMAAFISSQLEEKVIKDLDPNQKNGNTSNHKKIGRSTSVPSKLLQRNKSTKSLKEKNTKQSHNHVNGSPSSTRKSEIISSGYLKRALKAFTGEDENVPIIKSSIPISPKSNSPQNVKEENKDNNNNNNNNKNNNNYNRKEEFESINQLAERQIQLERYLSLLHCENQVEIGKNNATRVDEGSLQQVEPVESYTMKKDYHLQQYEEDIMNVEEHEKEEEEEDMELEDVEMDSVWDPDAYTKEYGYEYGYEYEDEENGVAFEDYYIHFEGDDEDDRQEEIEEEEETYNEYKGYNNNNRLSYDNNVPHIKVTSH